MREPHNGENTNLETDPFANAPISLYIVDNNHLFRQGLKHILADSPFRVAGEFSDISALRDATSEIQPGSIVLLDFPWAFNDPGADLEDLRRRNPAARLVVLTSHDDRDSFLNCLLAGIDGYLLKRISGQILIESLRLIVLGEKLFPALVANWFLDSCARSLPASELPGVAEVDLSKREIDIVKCLSEGYSNKKIARLLNISDATVKVHVKNVLRKIPATNRTEAAVWALTTGICHDAPATKPAGGEQREDSARASPVRATPRLAVVHPD